MSQKNPWLSAPMLSRRYWVSGRMAKEEGYTPVLPICTSGRTKFSVPAQISMR
jgi:hypothetical protein